MTGLKEYTRSKRRLDEARIGLWHLRQALRLMKDAPKTRQRIRHAIASAQGTVRNFGRRYNDEARHGPA